MLRGRGVFWENKSGLSPRGDTRKKKTEKHTHACLSHTATALQQQSCLNPSLRRRRPAPIEAQTTTQTLGGSLRRPGQKRRPRGFFFFYSRQHVLHMLGRLSSTGHVCAALLLRNTCTCPCQHSHLRGRAHPRLLRKQLHSPHSHDLLAPPRFVHPPKM